MSGPSRLCDAFDRDGLEDDCGFWAVLRGGGNLGDFLDDLVAFDQLVALLLGVDADSAGRAGKSDSATRTAADAINGRRSAGQRCSAADSASTTTAAHAAVSATVAVRSAAATTAAHAAVSATAAPAPTGAVRSATATTAGHAAVSATAASATTTVRPAERPVRGTGGLRASATNEARRRSASECSTTTRG